jgi:hypothetical protein
VDQHGVVVGKAGELLNLELGHAAVTFVLDGVWGGDPSGAPSR